MDPQAAYFQLLMALADLQYVAKDARRRWRICGDEVDVESIVRDIEETTLALTQAVKEMEPAKPEIVVSPGQQPLL